jgi:glycosyltransferase involved in cell wall biosynthesis
LRALAQQFSLQNVFFVGAQAPSLVPAWMTAAQIFVLPSLSEGLANAVLEAMAFGLPIVATDIPGTREVIQNGKTGFLFAPQNAKQLADCIEQLMSTESQRERLGQQAREYIDSEGLTTAHAVRRYLSLYGQVRALHPPLSFPPRRRAD